MIRLSDVRVGSTVSVRGGFGEFKPTRAKVLGVHREIKNGRPGIDYQISNAQGCSNWAYLDQVDYVIQY